MDKYSILILRALRKSYGMIHPSSFRLQCDQNPDSVAQIIYSSLTSENPCMIARFGATELQLIINYIGVKEPKKYKNIWSFIADESPAWWWEKQKVKQLQNYSGFFPIDLTLIAEYCEMMLNDIKAVDVLGSWQNDERYFTNVFLNIPKVMLLFLDPFWSIKPWTRALEGKKILVVHPFADTIKQQYKKRKFLFKENLLPEFELKTIKAVQSIAGNQPDYKNWFKALDYMKTEINKHDYDICLTGCGAYGFPLAAHVKRMGKKGFNMGGSLQLLFGIRGKRWENKNYNRDYDYSKLMNDFWVKPNEQEIPTNANLVEGACYW